MRAFCGAVTCLVGQQLGFEWRLLREAVGDIAGVGGLVFRAEIVRSCFAPLIVTISREHDDRSQRVYTGTTYAQKACQ
jgi:hypothetical protein